MRTVAAGGVGGRSGGAAREGQVMTTVVVHVDSKAELTTLLEQWEKDHGSGQDMVPILTRMSELIEKETEEYRKGDPDPFDDRHPGRADPECMLGHLLRILFKNDDFMNALVNAYVMTSREPPFKYCSLQTAAGHHAGPRNRSCLSRKGRNC